jgi:hypothetical protein
MYGVWYLLAVCGVCGVVAFTQYGVCNRGRSPLSTLSMIEERGPAGDDFITKMFGRFLPKPEDVGLKRYDSVSMPENWPCVKDEWADNLPEDTDPDIKLVRQVLAKTNMEYRPMKLAYCANRDGWKASAFHAKLDAMGPAVVLGRTKMGGVVGGYNPTGWVNLGEYRWVYSLPLSPSSPPLLLLSSFFPPLPLSPSPPPPSRPSPIPTYPYPLIPLSPHSHPFVSSLGTSY